HADDRGCQRRRGRIRHARRSLVRSPTQPSSRVRWRTPPLPRLAPRAAGAAGGAGGVPPAGPPLPGRAWHQHSDLTGNPPGRLPAARVPRQLDKGAVRAAVLRAPGEKLAIDDVWLRAPGPHDVHARVAASGVCRSDLSIQDGTIPHPLPAVLGHEGAGVVVDVGGAGGTLAGGGHVGLSWGAPGRRCFFCLRGPAALCEHGVGHAVAPPYATAHDGTALLAAFGTATYGEETIVPESACVPVAGDFPLELAALVGCGVVTGVGAVCNSAHVEAGASVAVVGCGGVGLAAVQ